MNDQELAQHMKTTPPPPPPPETDTVRAPLRKPPPPAMGCVLWRGEGERRGKKKGE
jgi:hypothetical protein